MNINIFYFIPINNKIFLHYFLKENSINTFERKIPKNVSFENSLCTKYSALSTNKLCKFRNING